MDFIKEILSKQNDVDELSEMRGGFLNDNIESLMLGISSQMRLAIKMLGVITNGSLIEKLGVQQIRDGFKWEKDFPISKAMMQALAMEMLDNSKEFMRLVCDELEDGFPDEDKYEVSDKLNTDACPELGSLLDEIKHNQDGALKKISAEQNPN